MYLLIASILFLQYTTRLEHFQVVFLIIWTYCSRYFIYLHSDDILKGSLSKGTPFDNDCSGKQVQSYK